MTMFKSQLKQECVTDEQCLHYLDRFDDAIERLYNSSWASTHLRSEEEIDFFLGLEFESKQRFDRESENLQINWSVDW